MRLRFPLGALLLSLALPPAFADTPAHARTCHLPGSEEALRCVTVSVPLDYAKPAGPAIALHVTVAPAFREAARPDPLFVLAGGPGQAGTDILPLLNGTFRKARATRDIVLIDQRGTGLSGKLDCDNKAAMDTMSEAQVDDALRACLKKAAPLAAYSTAASARDLERVRVALGYGVINVWGGSYGTRLAQQYARDFPARVRALVLDGVAAPEQIIPAGGRDSQTALDALFAQCTKDKACADAFPALRSEFASLVERAAKGIELDISDPRTARPLHVSMSSARFLGTVHSILYSPPDARRLPFLVHSAYLGRWEPFIARSNVAADFAGDGATSFVMHMAVVCAEDYPRLSEALLADDTRGSFMSAPVVARMAGLCEVTGTSAVPYRTPARIDVPVLMLSGALDPVTPPRRAEAAAAYMGHAQHLVVAQAGHGISSLGCAPRLLREFLDKPELKVAADCLKDIPAPSFQLGSAGPQP